MELDEESKRLWAEFWNVNGCRGLFDNPIISEIVVYRKVTDDDCTMSVGNSEDPMPDGVIDVTMSVTMNASELFFGKGLPELLREH